MRGSPGAITLSKNLISRMRTNASCGSQKELPLFPPTSKTRSRYIRLPDGAVCTMSESTRLWLRALAVCEDSKWRRGAGRGAARRESDRQKKEGERQCRRQRMEEAEGMERGPVVLFNP